MAKNLVIVMPSETHRDVARAAGVPLSGVSFDHCELHVGDILSYPSAPGLFFRVAKRWYEAGVDAVTAGTWRVFLEKAPNPAERAPQPSDPRSS